MAATADCDCLFALVKGQWEAVRTAVQTSPARIATELFIDGSQAAPEFLAALGRRPELEAGLAIALWHHQQQIQQQMDR